MLEGIAHGFFVARRVALQIQLCAAIVLQLSAADPIVFRFCLRLSLAFPEVSVLWCYSFPYFPFKIRCRFFLFFRCSFFLLIVPFFSMLLSLIRVPWEKKPGSEDGKIGKFQFSFLLI